MLDSDHKWKLLANKVEGAITDSDLLALEEILSRHPKLQLLLQIVAALSNESADVNTEVANNAYENLRNKLRKSCTDFN